jgi:hypothetical protein
MLASVNWRWNENSSLKPENQWFLLQRHYDHDSVYDSVHVCKLLAQIERNLGIPWELWRFSTETLREPSLPVGRWFLADHLCPPLEARTGATYHMTSWFFCWDFLFNTHIYTYTYVLTHHNHYIPSGKRLHNYGKSWKITMFTTMIIFPLVI